MATGSKAGLYKNAQSASYLPLTLVISKFSKNNCLFLDKGSKKLERILYVFIKYQQYISKNFLNNIL